MCGIVGVFAKDSNSNTDVVGKLLESLGNVEHRGKDNCGTLGVRLGPSKRPLISRIRSEKPPHDIFPSSRVDSYKDHNPSLHTLLNKVDGSVALGHSRFTTSGTPGIVNCQPIIYFLEENVLEALNDATNDASFRFDFIPNTPDIESWIGISHNGEVNKAVLDRLIEDAGYENIPHSVSSDSGSLAAYLLMEANEKGSIEGALKSLFKNVPGAWSLLGVLYLDGEFGAFATKDRYGVHPMSKTWHGTTMRYASENSVFRRVGINYYSDIQPGEADILHYDDSGRLDTVTVQIADPVPRMCAFEVIYNMAPETRIPFNIRLFDPDYLDVICGTKTIEEYDLEKPGFSDMTDMFEVSTIRKRIGEILYETVAGCIDGCDILCGVPRSGLSYAEGIGSASGKNPRELIYINPAYAKERSFQGSTKKAREKAIKNKLLYKRVEECMDSESIYRNAKGCCKKECCVTACEDSSVTGNAAINVVQKLKAHYSKGGSGADRAGLIIAAPPILDPCYLGINQKFNENLVNAVGRAYGVENPRELAINNLGAFQNMAAEFVGADYMIFGTVSIMNAIFDRRQYGFSCVGAGACAPYE